MRFVWVAILLAGCASKPDKIPTQPDSPTTSGNMSKVGEQIDKSGSKVAAAVTVARENAEKPEVVKAETTVALSYLPTPPEAEVSLARQRAGKADQKDYAAAVEYGKKLLAKIDADWAKMENDRKEAARISALKDARIAELTKEIETVKQEASANIWTMTGAGLVVIGSLACAFASIRIGIPIIICGAFAGSLPFFFDSPYFVVISTITLAIVAGLGVWWIYDRVKDSVNSSDVKGD